jgi:hypothetical protein
MQFNYVCLYFGGHSITFFWILVFKCFVLLHMYKDVREGYMVVPQMLG